MFVPRPSLVSALFEVYFFLMKSSTSYSVILFFLFLFSFLFSFLFFSFFQDQAAASDLWCPETHSKSLCLKFPNFFGQKQQQQQPRRRRRGTDLDLQWRHRQNRQISWWWRWGAWRPTASAPGSTALAGRVVISGQGVCSKDTLLLCHGTNR